MAHSVLIRLATQTSLSFMFDAEYNLVDDDFNKINTADKTRFYQCLLVEHQQIVIDFEAICNQIITDSAACTKEQLRAGILLAKFLECNYKNLKMYGFHEKTQRYIKALYALNADDAELWKPAVERPLNHALDIVVDSYIRERTAFYNFWRLLFIRTKRLLEALVAVIVWSPYIQIVKQFSKYSSPLLAIVSWLFYVPRLLTNIYLVIAHFYAYLIADEIQKKYYYSLFCVQFHYRWFELFNDTLWFLGGLSTCFVLVGSLQPLAVYFTIIFYVYDILLPCIRFYIERNRAITLYNQYVDSFAISALDKQQLLSYCECLQQKINFEKKRLLVSVINTTLLTIAMVICLPAFAISPVIPIFGAILLIAITVGCYVINKKVEALRPVCTIDALNVHTIFGGRKINDQSTPVQNDSTEDTPRTRSAASR